MSRLSELAETMRNESEQQAEHTRQMLHSVMQQHRQAIENDLNELRSAIGNSIRATGEETERNLRERLSARPKRIARLWWTISAVGVLAAGLMWGLSFWQGKRAWEYLNEAESLKNSGAKVTTCQKQNGGKVPCVLVRTGESWKGNSGKTAYMEISR